MNTHRQSDAIEVRQLERTELPAAISVIARGMRDNPLHIAAYGPYPQRRLKCHSRLIRARFNATPDMPIFGAFDGDQLLAVAAEAPVGTCRLSPRQFAREAPRLVGLGPRTALRVGRWVSTWADFDPPEPHVHLGPVAVDARLQGRGLGTTIVQHHCRRLDESGRMGYLETDKEVNVRFYERFGYQVVREAAVLGVPTWFMERSRR
ncbi:hypothetical protein GCM10022261_14730 [Brevibacterium daeguense]|uniref:N-acetyltransferase domain-containing protein n=1 Tax=Brevibacterium daeguense TaxID=909936 RepID=A0ABP8EJ18_9MICO|nr:GNAT family N-acetyltransferase [Brevibacterium daeguense]